jgi:hypothetical protein
MKPCLLLKPTMVSKVGVPVYAKPVFLMKSAFRSGRTVQIMEKAPKKVKIGPLSKPETGFEPL